MADIELFDLNLIFTIHAEKRMKERHIDKEVVKSIFTKEAFIWHNARDGKHKLIFRKKNITRRFKLKNN